MVAMVVPNKPKLSVILSMAANTPVNNSMAAPKSPLSNKFWNTPTPVSFRALSLYSSLLTAQQSRFTTSIQTAGPMLCFTLTAMTAQNPTERGQPIPR